MRADDRAAKDVDRTERSGLWSDPNVRIWRDLATPLEVGTGRAG